MSRFSVVLLPPAELCLVGQCAAEFGNANQGSLVLGVAQDWERGANACLFLAAQLPAACDPSMGVFHWWWCLPNLWEGGKIGPCSKPTRFNDLLRVIYSFSRRSVHLRSLLNAANSPFCWTQSWQDGVTSIWKAVLVHFF